MNNTIKVSEQMALDQFSSYFRAYTDRDYELLEKYLGEDRVTRNSIEKSLKHIDDGQINMIRFAQTYNIFNKILEEKI